MTQLFLYCIRLHHRGKEVKVIIFDINPLRTGGVGLLCVWMIKTVTQVLNGMSLQNVNCPILGGVRRLDLEIVV